MSGHVVPRALVVPGPVPRRFVGKSKAKNPEPARCSVCGLLYDEHSGSTCAICRGPVEHHVDAEAMADEIDGYGRVSAARAHAGLPISDAAQWCIGHASEMEHAA